MVGNDFYIFVTRIGFGATIADFSSGANCFMN